MKVLIAAGGSGGHIFPALCLAEELKKHHHEIFFVTTRGPMVEKIGQSGFLCETVSAKGFSTASFPLFLSSVFLMAKAVVESKWLLWKYRPDVVVGFGGYSAFPVVFASSLLLFPTLIHEQNVVPGRANRFLAQLTRKVAVSFKESEKYFLPGKTVWTGCPCREFKEKLSKEEILKKFNLTGDRVTILALGGSQGSHKINQQLFEAAVLLKQDLNFQVIHIAGQKDCEALKEKYRQAGLAAVVFSFFDDMDEAYRAADLVIARAGAMTVFEIAMFRLPAILIPYPYAGGHQKENAKVLSDAGVAKIIEEGDLSPQVLKNVIFSTVKEKTDYDTMNQRVKNIYVPDAALRLAKEVEALKK